jgi:hypothetical protein
MIVLFPGTRPPPYGCGDMAADLVIRILTVLVFVGIFVFSFAINWH